MSNHRWRYVGKRTAQGRRDAVCVHLHCQARRLAAGGYQVCGRFELRRPQCPAGVMRAAAAPPAPSAPAFQTLRLSNGRHFRYALPPGSLSISEVRRIAMHLLTLSEEWPDGAEVPELAGQLFLQDGAATPGGEPCSS